MDGNGEIDFMEFTVMMQKLISDDKKAAGEFDLHVNQIANAGGASATPV